MSSGARDESASLSVKPAELSGPNEALASDEHAAVSVVDRGRLSDCPKLDRGIQIVW
jgi:hypothetical protein